MPTLQESLVTALSGLASGRVYPVVAPPDVSAPWITYFRVGGAPQHTLNDGESITHTRMQIDCFAETYSAAQALANSIYTAVTGMGATGIFDPLRASAPEDLYEEAVGLYRVTQDFSFWHTL